MNINKQEHQEEAINWSFFPENDFILHIQLIFHHKIGFQSRRQSKCLLLLPKFIRKWFLIVGNRSFFLLIRRFLNLNMASLILTLKRKECQPKNDDANDRAASETGAIRDRPIWNDQSAATIAAAQVHTHTQTAKWCWAKKLKWNYWKKTGNSWTLVDDRLVQFRTKSFLSLLSPIPSPCVYVWSSFGRHTQMQMQLLPTCGLFISSSFANRFHKFGGRQSRPSSSWLSSSFFLPPPSSLLAIIASQLIHFRCIIRTHQQPSRWTVCVGWTAVLGSKWFQLCRRCGFFLLEIELPISHQK